jgi:hypothetical protein
LVSDSRPDRLAGRISDGSGVLFRKKKIKRTARAGGNAKGNVSAVKKNEAGYLATFYSF